MINDFIPGLDIISTFFTVAYLGWLMSRELRCFGSPFQGAMTSDGSQSIKRSLLNQHVYR